MPDYLFKSIFAQFSSTSIGMDKSDVLCEKCHAQERAAFYRAG